MLKSLFQINKKNLIWIIVLLLIIAWFVYCIFRDNFSIKENYLVEIDNEQRISLSDFSSTLNISKEWTLLPYPEITIFSDVDWIISNINVSEWDFVKKGKILMTIKNIYDDYSAELENSQIIIDDLQKQHDNKKIEYEKSELWYLEKFEELKNNLSYAENSLSASISQSDTEWLQIRTNQIENIENQISSIQVEQWISKQNYISEMNNIENEIKAERNRYDMYYNKLNQLTPRATIDWIVNDINVNQWDNIYDWDVVLKIININQTPEISVELDFDEYLLTESITWASIVINLKDWDQYFIQKFSWVVATRNPTINENEKYEVTLQMLDFSWKNITNIDDVGIIFHVKSEWLRINESCINYSWDNKSFVKLSNSWWEFTQDVDIISQYWDLSLINNDWLLNLQDKSVWKKSDLEKIDYWKENGIVISDDTKILCKNRN